MPMKVYELAEEYQIEAKALLNHLRDLGVFVSSHMSLLDEDEVAKVRSTITHVQKRQEISEKRIKPTVIRRRMVKAQVEEPVDQKVEAAAPAVEAAAPETEPEVETAPEEPVEEVAVGLEAQEVQVELEPASVPEEKPKPPKKTKKKKSFQAAVVIQKPAPSPIIQPEEMEIQPAPEEISQPAVTFEESEDLSAAVEEVVEVKASAEGAEKARPAKEGRAKKVRGERRVSEAAKIVEKPKPEVLQRIAPPTEEVQSILAPVGPEPESEEAKRARPKRRKSLKAFEVIREEKPARGRGARRKEVIQLRDETRERAARAAPKKKRTREPQKTEVTVPKAIKRKIRITESITVGELAKRMGVKSADVIRQLIGLGAMATVNQLLDPDEASLLAGEFGYEVERIISRAEEILEEVETAEAAADLQPRPPVVTVMGHVDHGKTSLLDAIRQTQVTDEEVGGITQHIGAYQASIGGQKITFLDTPGHEAFTSLRARGAQVTDIVVLVVAADDGVMNQTKEAIDHARSANVPIIVAINKIDKPNAEPDRVKQDLGNFGLMPEEWGGDALFCEVSAKEKVGIDELLESILLQSEMLELKSNKDKLARGTIVEAKLDRHRGPVATILVQEGTLRRNDPFVAGVYAGKVRVMMDHRGKTLEAAGPSTPVEVIGASGVPLAGEKFIVLADEKEARDIEAYRQDRLRKDEMARGARVTLDGIMERMDAGEVKELPVVIKGDVQGSIETLKETLSGMGGEKIQIQVVHASVGGITENDVNLASASKAVIIGFNVRPEPRAQTLADDLGVDIRIYNIIYELIEEVEKALLGMLEPIQQENPLGYGEVIQLFKVSKVGTVAGTMVQQGKVLNQARVRLVRDGVVVYDGKLDSLRRYQNDAKEVLEGQDCGVHLENFNDVKLGDRMEFYELEEVAPEL